MTVEPTCPGCKSRENFKLIEWVIKNETGTKELVGTFIYCGKCGTAINWIPKQGQF